MSLASSLAVDDDTASAIEEAVRLEVARELHDQVGQGLAVLLLQMEDFKAEQFGRSGVQAEVSQYQTSVREVLANIREVLQGLRGAYTGLPTSLDELLGETVRRVRARTGLPIRLTIDRSWREKLPARLASQIQRIVQEALLNAALHSGAESVHVRLTKDRDGNGVVAVVDDGRGSDSYMSKQSHFGLEGMRERALSIGGQVTVERGYRCGTVVCLTIPAERLDW